MFTMLMLWIIILGGWVAGAILIALLIKTITGEIKKEYLQIILGWPVYLVGIVYISAISGAINLIYKIVDHTPDP